MYWFDQSVLDFLTMIRFFDEDYRFDCLFYGYRLVQNSATDHTYNCNLEKI